MRRIEQLRGLEILDSRGRPTVKVTIFLDDGSKASASVPSGASTGQAEAVELRDADNTRYDGRGCRRAVEHIHGEIIQALRGEVFESVFDVDQRLIELDGTDNKARLGANAILAVSLAFARAQAESQELPLFRYLARLIDDRARKLPRLTVNLFSGGLHAGGIVPIQDSLVVPVSARTINESLVMTHAVYQSAIELMRQRYGARALTADEGGLSPDFDGGESMLALTVDAIQHAGLRPGVDVAMAVDVAASHFLL